MRLAPRRRLERGQARTIPRNRGQVPRGTDIWGLSRRDHEDSAHGTCGDRSIGQGEQGHAPDLAEVARSRASFRGEYLPICRPMHRGCVGDATCIVAAPQCTPRRGVLHGTCTAQQLRGCAAIFLTRRRLDRGVRCKYIVWAFHAPTHGVTIEEPRLHQHRGSFSGVNRPRSHGCEVAVATLGAAARQAQGGEPAASRASNSTHTLPENSRHVRPATILRSTHASRAGTRRHAFASRGCPRPIARTKRLSTSTNASTRNLCET